MGCGGWENTHTQLGLLLLLSLGRSVRQFLHCRLASCRGVLAWAPHSIISGAAIPQDSRFRF